MPDGLDQSCTLTSAGRDGALSVPSLAVAATSPDGTVVEARLDLRPIVVGTSPECDVVIVDPRVSRRHCEIALTADGVVLRDLGSKNGTLVGKAAIREAVIPPDTAITIGGSKLLVRHAGASTLVPLSPTGSFGGAVGQSYIMRALFARLERAAATTQTILLAGESGTGKEVLARAIHDQSPRRGGPFVVLDCGAISANLMESEVFGYARGAFTGAAGARAGLLEEADGGTLFIDEIGELPLDLQPKLLRAIEARQVRRLGSSDWRPFDARIVAATHRDLRARVNDGSFRGDLYYRLAVVEVRVPALRERKDDIPALVERFLVAHDPPRTLSDLPPHALSLLAGYAFPGNVRELRNLVARLVLFPDQDLDLSESSDGEAPAPRAGPAAAAPGGDPDRLRALLELPLPAAREMVMERFERSYLSAKLAQHAGNISRAADAMGVSRQLVHRLLDRYGIKAK
jgi:transcriptional regulator with PAS, ATPase and Fis domain